MGKNSKFPSQEPDLFISVKITAASIPISQSDKLYLQLFPEFFCQQNYPKKAPLLVDIYSPRHHGKKSCFFRPLRGCQADLLPGKVLLWCVISKTKNSEGNPTGGNLRCYSSRYGRKCHLVCVSKAAEKPQDVRTGVGIERILQGNATKFNV